MVYSCTHMATVGFKGLTAHSCWLYYAAILQTLNSSVKPFFWRSAHCWQSHYTSLTTEVTRTHHMNQTTNNKQI